MAKDLEKQYNPADVEDRTYQFWVDNGYFHADVKSIKSLIQSSFPSEHYRSASYGTCS